MKLIRMGSARPAAAALFLLDGFRIPELFSTASIGQLLESSIIEYGIVVHGPSNA